MKICGIYKITNTITGDSYIGSSKNIKERWMNHKKPSTCKRFPSNPLYLDMKKYGVDKFDFQILAEAEIDSLKDVEQKFIETLKPTYNSNNAKGFDIERRKEWQKDYDKTDKRKESKRKANRKYYKSDKGKETKRKYNNKYNNQLCYFNGETLTLNALAARFWRQGIDLSTTEAKKYLIKR